VAEIWITFPDPQMKKATKRLTSTYFMQRYIQLLQPNGLIHLKTDSPFLYTYTQAMVKENKYQLLVDTNDLYAAEASADIDEARSLQTHYEHQWLDRGLTIKYLRWELSHADQLVEPDIDIEKDTYRSYGRNYVSSTNN
jgi:tRNA (guanine-N7-)-methyltransferase